MKETRNRNLKMLSFLIGLALPLAGLLIWSRSGSRLVTRKNEIDRAHDITVEDSFPASDPPSAW